MVILLAAGMSGAALTTHAGELAAPAEPQVRIIVDADTANEIDDLFAIMQDGYPGFTDELYHPDPLTTC